MAVETWLIPTAPHSPLSAGCRACIQGAQPGVRVQMLRRRPGYAGNMAGPLPPGQFRQNVPAPLQAEVRLFALSGITWCSSLSRFRARLRERLPPSMLGAALHKPPAGFADIPISRRSRSGPLWAAPVLPLMVPSSRRTVPGNDAFHGAKSRRQGPCAPAPRSGTPS